MQIDRNLPRGKGMTGDLGDQEVKGQGHKSVF